MNKILFIIASIFGCSAVMLGAFGAHTLKEMIDENGMRIFEKGVSYQFYHTFAIFIAILLFAAPSVITDGTKRLVKHSEYFEKQAPFQFVITNNELKTVAQQDFELKVKLTGNEVP